MVLNEQGFSIIEISPVDEKFMDSFEDLPPDAYCGGKHRHRRFSQYRMRFKEGCWHLERLPHRPFIQPRKYNDFVGGSFRDFKPLQIDPSEQVDIGAKAIPLDTSIDWFTNIHQYRIIVNPEVPGISVPEGPHRDGHEYVMISVLRRHKIIGAEMTLMPLGGGEPFFRTTLQEGQAVLLDDEKMFHDVTDIEAEEFEGYRDLFVIVFDKWENRRYGPEFEKESLVS